MGEVSRFGIKPNAINYIGMLLRNNLTYVQCVTVLNQRVTKNRHPKNRSASLPSSTSSPHIDKWIELFPALKKLPKARKSRAFGLNNVLDFSERISFF
jgi:hypothetical protein